MGLVLFDGVCALCDGSVRALISIDKNERLRFAPLQGPTAGAVLAAHSGVSRDLSTMLYVRGNADSEELFERSDAVFAILQDVGGVWGLLSVLRWVPRPIRDGVYRFVAKRRYRWFGQFESCRLPTPETRLRFLD